MIDALSLFFGPPGNAALGNGQPGDIWSDKSKTSGNPSDNPFAKILRDQSAASSLLKSLQFTVPSKVQKRLSALESLPNHSELSQQVLAGKDIPVDVLREISSHMVELPPSVDAPPNPYVATFLKSEGKRVKELEDVIPTSSISLTSLGVKGRSEIGKTEIPKTPMGSLAVNNSQEGQQSGVVMLSHVFSVGGLGADGAQTKTSSNKPGVPFLTGYSPGKVPPPVQMPPDGRSLADTSARDIVAKSERQPLLRDVVKDISQLAGTSDGEPGTESAGDPGKNAGKLLDHIASPVKDGDMLLPRIPTPPAVAPQGPLGPLVNQAFQIPSPYAEGSAGMTEVAQSRQGPMKDMNGVVSLLGESSSNGKESLMGIPSDQLGDSSLSSADDRSKDVVDAVGKSVGVDTNGGQDVNNGMGGSNHSQQGFQQSSSSHSPGSGLRMAEERAPDLPNPPLQRLQMDVQLSETNRIQIDVGVQQRQVYAGLLMDHATLKNLAVQFVPQLENQLAQVDMDLQEFSAEVRDQHGGQESDTSSQWSKTQQVQRGTTPLLHAPESLPSSGKRVEEPGFYLVA